LVLVVDDDQAIVSLVEIELRAQGFHVLSANNGEEALRKAVEQRPDIVVIDIVMPEMSGHELLRRLRETSNVPVIFLTGKDTDSDRVTGLELGADDYVVKPFAPEELAARIRAVLRRSLATPQYGNVVQAGVVEIDLDRRLVKRNGNLVSLSGTEWILLQYLAQNAGRIVLNAQLLSDVWGPNYKEEVDYLRVWISRLRRKLEEDPSKPALIKTHIGIGYMLDPIAASSTQEDLTPPVREGSST
jgi:two-component system KDP operon response regulator KdpE